MQSLAFHLNNVNKDYSGFSLKNINLQLEAGQIMGFIGPNGAGKSTTIRLLMGLIQQDSGEINVLGHQLPKQHKLAKLEIGYASDDMQLYPQASLTWHMEYINSFYPNWDQQYAKQLLKQFDLKAEQKIKTMSFGQKIKANLLLVLARRPKLLILDEPTTGLDPVARHEILNEFMEVLLDEERSILFSSHNTQDIEQLSDQIAFIDQGKIIKCQDKEAYLDSWKRLRLNYLEKTPVPKLPGVVEQTIFANHANIITQQYSSDTAQQYLQHGVNVSSVERMTLEEIFIAEIQASRNSNG